MSKTISHEQDLAIKSENGTVLSAGAGAGKTFVIIEHFIEIIHRYRDKKGSEGIEDFLSKIVIITFTNKAARELKKRVENKLKLLSLESSFWEKVYENRSVCFIGTIHSYCFSLLRASKDLEFSRFEIVDDAMIKQKIKHEIIEYIEINPRILEDFSIKELQHSLEKIFFTPRLRVLWGKDLKSFDEDSLIVDFFNLYPVDMNFSYDNSKKLKWVEFLSSFGMMIEESDPKKRLRNLSHLFNDLKRLPTPSKKSVAPEVSKAFSEIKDLKSALIEFAESLNRFDKSLELRAQELQKLFFSVSKSYFEDGKISFSDIEYLMLTNKESIESKIEEIVVDEFQDVSYTQFEIFKNLVKGDFKKIFAVGDKKQAIYGFRGGEVSVFESLAEKITNNLSMIDNYRSFQKVVKFNNDLFQPEFPLEKVQKPQIEEMGEVCFYDIETSNEEPDLKILETEALFSVVLEKLEAGVSELAILYRFMPPAQDLMRRLIEHDIGFHCSLKIAKSRDPMLSIFTHLLSFKVEKQAIENAAFFIQGYFDYLNIPVTGLLDAIKDFSSSLSFMGLDISWIRFLSRLGVDYGHVDLHLNEIQQLEGYYAGSRTKILYALKETADERIEINVSSKLSQAKIHLMTAHSSKGLEFEEVIVANILTNNRGRSDHLVLGETPLSFSYKYENKRYLTPRFLLERRESSLKQEKESLRLFYVACTRAVKKLSFITGLKFHEKVKEKTWGYYLQNNLPDSKKYDVKDLKVEKLSEIRPIELFQDLDFQITGNQKLYNVSIMPEVSVARLSLLKICPKRFFIEEIIGLDEKDYVVKENSGAGVVSSAERGTKVHEEISNFFLTGKLPKGKPYEYFQKVFKEYESFSITSEKEMKFQVEGKMISGTPDLVLEKGSVLEVWDFKTGAQSTDKNLIYLTQASLYLYGWIQNHQKSYEKIVSRVLYLDEGITVEQVFKGISELESEIENLISRVYFYQKEYPEHPSECSCKVFFPTESVLSDNQVS